MKAHYINPYFYKGFKTYNLLLIENDIESVEYEKTIFRGELIFNENDSDDYLLLEATRILNSIDDTKIINEFIVDKPKWQF